MIFCVEAVDLNNAEKPHRGHETYATNNQARDNDIGARQTRIYFGSHLLWVINLVRLPMRGNSLSTVGLNQNEK